jgi:hypothetical protein
MQIKITKTHSLSIYFWQRAIPDIRVWFGIQCWSSELWHGFEITIANIDIIKIVLSRDL